MQSKSLLWYLIFGKIGCRVLILMLNDMTSYVRLGWLEVMFVILLSNITFLKKWYDIILFTKVTFRVAPALGTFLFKTIQLLAYALSTLWKELPSFRSNKQQSPRYLGLHINGNKTKYMVATSAPKKKGTTTSNNTDQLKTTKIGEYNFETGDNLKPQSITAMVMKSAYGCF